LKDGVYEEKNGVRVVHDKSRYDAFEGTNLLHYLRERGYVFDREQERERGRERERRGTKAEKEKERQEVAGSFLLLLVLSSPYYNSVRSTVC
jgi:hypothetical protein